MLEEEAGKTRWRKKPMPEEERGARRAEAAMGGSRARAVEDSRLQSRPPRRPDPNISAAGPAARRRRLRRARDPARSCCCGCLRGGLGRWGRRGQPRPRALRSFPTRRPTSRLARQTTAGSSSSSSEEEEGGMLEGLTQLQQSSSFYKLQSPLPI